MFYGIFLISVAWPSRYLSLSLVFRNFLSPVFRNFAAE